MIMKPNCYCGLIIALFVVCQGLWLAADALPCFNHDHCGEHAVCVSMGHGKTPKCMCLVGFVGNGARCERLDSSPTTPIEDVDKLVLQKSGCSTPASSSSEEGGGPPAIRPTGVPRAKNDSKSKAASDEKLGRLSRDRAGNSGAKRSTETRDERLLNDPGNGGKTSGGDHPLLITPPPLDSIPAASLKACEKVNCDFDTDSCRYRSMGQTTWVRKAKATFGDAKNDAAGHVAVTKSGSSPDQYLASENFVLLEQSQLRFEYFENDHSSHLQLCDNDLSHCFWQSEGANGKWKDASVILSSGSHRIIFAASDLGPNLNVAIDNIRIERGEDQAAPCV